MFKKSIIKRPVVCILGTLRCLSITATQLIEKLLEPLQADLIICVSRMTDEDEKNLDYFPEINIVKVDIYEDARKGYEKLYDFYTKKYGFENRLSELTKIEGNWLGGLEKRPGSGMHLNYNYWKLWELIKNLQEQGIEYERYIITRSDLLWTLRHPPLEKLNPRNIWIPTGEDNYGYNDRHAVCSSSNINNYLSLFEYMLDLRTLKYLRNRDEINHEAQLKRHLDYCGMRVRRFKNTAYLTADDNTATRWATSKETNINGKDYKYKYYNELLNAITHRDEFNAHQNWDKMIIEASLIRDYLDLLKINCYYRMPDFIDLKKIRSIL